jgi:hypothetical protein
MAVIVTTRLHALSLRHSRQINRLTSQVVADLATQPGFLGARIMIAGPRTFWTLSAWSSGRDLAAFGHAHAAISSRAPEVTEDMSMTSWQSSDRSLPQWDEAARHWTDGKGPGWGLRKVVAPQPVASQEARLG